MARAIFSHEVVDPDFQWLLTNYAERNPGSFTVDATCLPVVLVLLTDEERTRTQPFQEALPPVPVSPPTEGTDREDTPPE